jgi:cobalt/nickel transport system permease protein
VLELGALGLIGETFLSGRSELPFGPFLVLMLGIHLPIALAEGLITAAVIGYVYKLRPEIAHRTFRGATEGRRRRSLTPVLTSLVAAALLTGGVAAWFASSKPDGLEWSLGRLTGSEKPPSQNGWPASRRGRPPWPITG